MMVTKITVNLKQKRNVFKLQCTKFSFTKKITADWTLRVMKIFKRNIVILFMSFRATLKLFLKLGKSEKCFKNFSGEISL
jgi:hypothetical protein